MLVDDGSSDAIGLICDVWQKQFSIIRVIHQENIGRSAARNVHMIDFSICFPMLLLGEGLLRQPNSDDVVDFYQLSDAAVFHKIGNSPFVAEVTMSTVPA